MDVWVPWDADDDERASLTVVREPIPDSMRPALHQWIFDEMHTGYQQTSASVVNSMQTALRVRLTYESGSISTASLVELLASRGDQLLLRVVDYLLAGYELDSYGRVPPQVKGLMWHLDTSSSAVQVTSMSGMFRLARRLPEGVESLIEVAVEAAPDLAGRHLAQAFIESQKVEPNTSLVMSEGIKAVEAAAGPIVTPKDRSFRLGKIVASLKDKKWTVLLATRDDDHPDHRALLIGMLETLAFSQQDRHSGEPPTIAAAQAHALLAATVVGWFAVHIIRFET